MIEPFNLRLLQKTQNVFLKLSAALAGNYLHQRDLFTDCLIDHPVQLRVNGLAFIKNIMQI